MPSEHRDLLGRQHRTGARTAPSRPTGTIATPERAAHPTAGWFSRLRAAQGRARSWSRQRHRSVGACYLGQLLHGGQCGPSGTQAECAQQLVRTALDRICLQVPRDRERLDADPRGLARLWPLGLQQRHSEVETRQRKVLEVEPLIPARPQRLVPTDRLARELLSPRIVRPQPRRRVVGRIPTRLADDLERLVEPALIERDPRLAACGRGEQQVLVELFAEVASDAQVRPRCLVVAEVEREPPLVVGEMPSQQLQACTLLAGVTTFPQQRSDLLELLVRNRQQSRNRLRRGLLGQPQRFLVVLVEGQRTDVRALDVAKERPRPRRTGRDQCAERLDCLASVRVVLPRGRLRVRLQCQRAARVAWLLKIRRLPGRLGRLVAPPAGGCLHLAEELPTPLRSDSLARLVLGEQLRVGAGERAAQLAELIYPRDQGRVRLGLAGLDVAEETMRDPELFGERPDGQAPVALH